jgi:hypothetical protein
MITHVHSFIIITAYAESQDEPRPTALTYSLHPQNVSPRALLALAVSGIRRALSIL